MGAMLSGRWHTWQRFCKMGAMSLVKVTCAAAVVAQAAKMTPEIEAFPPDRCIHASFATWIKYTWKSRRVATRY
jgi:hypothetical protein